MIYYQKKTGAFLFVAILTVCFLITCPIITMGGIVDLIPPEITVISPIENGVIETGKPLIEAEFGDSGAGINETTIFLALDRVEVTDNAIIENMNISGQTGSYPYRIRYRPVVSLIPGEHEVYFSVRDQAGNLAELRWRFTVSLPRQGEIDISGTNTLRWDQSPLMKTTDVFDIAAQAKVANTDVRLQLSCHGTDYPDDTPNFQYDQYRFYLDKYSLSLQGQTSTLLVGFGVTPIQSELFQNGMEVEGGIYTQKIHFTRGQLDWGVFTGETGGSYGLDINVEEIQGATCGWESGSDWKVGTFYAQLGGNAGYDIIGLQGNTLFDNGFLAQFEWLTKNSKNDGASENGLALHLGQTFQSLEIILDYLRSQPVHAAATLSLSLSPESSGFQRIGLRIVTTLNPQQNLSLNLSFAEYNLDHSNLNTVTQSNVSVDYSYIPNPALNLNVNYVEGLQNTQVASSSSDNKSDNTLTLSVKKNINQSALQTSLSLTESKLPAPQLSSNQTNFGSAWTFPLGSYNLTPSLKLTTKTESDNSIHRTAETRLTLDFQTSSAPTRNNVALIWHSNAEQLFSGQLSNLSTLSLESTLFLSLWPNSILSATCNFSHWLREDSVLSDGWDQTLSLTWKISF